MRSPPNRSAKAPQNCREMNAQPSITDSIAAPWLGVMPTSPQNATRWEDGIAIGTQQQKPATQSSAMHHVGTQTEHLPPGRGAA